MHIFYLFSPGDRPPYYKLAEHLWGAGCDIDSDGNSASRDARDWTELMICLRPSWNERIDIDPVSSAEQLVLSIRSNDEKLAHRAAVFLHEVAGGELTKA